MRPLVRPTWTPTSVTCCPSFIAKICATWFWLGIAKVWCDRRRRPCRDGWACLMRPLTMPSVGRRKNLIASKPGWKYFEIDVSQSPNMTAPEELVHLFMQSLR